MNLLDRDLSSRQEVRDLLRKAEAAQKQLARMKQAEIDVICQKIVEVALANNDSLAKIAAQETGFGLWQDKAIKNKFASEVVWSRIKSLKTIGVIAEDKANKIVEIAVPVGVIAALVPSTNPTSTVIYKAIIALKAGNSIVFSPHPNALNCIIETVKLLKVAIEEAGGPKDIVGTITLPSLPGTKELMENKITKLILATGGEVMVRAAYSSGKPAIGVGAGNGPAFIEKSANIEKAVKHILTSKTFDNGTICASEQSIIVESVNKQTVVAELKKQGAYFLTTEQKAQLGKYLLTAKGTMNPAIVGKSANAIANLVGITVPAGSKLLIAEETEVGKCVPYSREKLAPILAFYTVEAWQEACNLSRQILENEGAGHTSVIHSENEMIIREYALKQPVSRILVNTAGALGGIGGTTNLFPALTLGCGAIGGSSTSDNIGPSHLFNVRRVAYGTCGVENLRTETGTQVEEQLIEQLVEKVLAKLAN